MTQLTLESILLFVHVLDRLVITALLSAICSVCFGAVHAPIETAAEVLHLDRKTARQGHPALLQGVVTYYREGTSYSDLIIQDQTGGVFISDTHSIPLPVLKPGTRIQVEGTTEAGNFAPGVHAHSVRRLGDGQLPEPLHVSYDELRSGKFNCRYIEIRGVVRSATVDQTLKPARQILRIATGAGYFDAWVLKFEEAAGRSLVGAVVRVNGVCLAWENSRRQNTGLRVVVNDLDFIHVEEPAPVNPFDAPSVAFDELLRYRPDGLRQQQVRVRGTVVWSRPGEGFVLEHGRYGIRVETDEGDPLQLGDEVEAVGFPEPMGYTAGLCDAKYRVMAHPGEVAPEKFTVSDLSSGKWHSDPDHKLITVQGTLRAIQRDSQNITLLMEEASHAFPASLSAAMSIPAIEKLEPGSVLELTGVCQFRQSEQQLRMGIRPNAFALLLRNPGDVRLIRSGPWLTRSRLLAIVAIGCGGLVTALIWAFTLRRLVAKRSLQVVREIRARHDAEVEFNAVNAERNRVAAELHDTLSQSLTGVALQLQAATLACTHDPTRISEHVTTACDLVGRCREDLRRSVWDLRNGGESKRNLVSELEEIAAELNGCGGPKIRIIVKNAPGLLPAVIVQNMLRFCQEAITNAVQHARANCITVSIDHQLTHLILQVSDDGIGFAPEKAAGASSGHFGLYGMHERAQRFGAILNIKSAPGSGTCLCLELPL